MFAITKTRNDKSFIIIEFDEVGGLMTKNGVTVRHNGIYEGYHFTREAAELALKRMLLEIQYKKGIALRKQSEVYKNWSEESNDEDYKIKMYQMYQKAMLKSHDLIHDYYAKRDELNGA